LTRNSASQSDDGVVLVPAGAPLTLPKLPPLLGLLALLAPAAGAGAPRPAASLTAWLAGPARVVTGTAGFKGLVGVIEIPVN